MLSFSKYHGTGNDFVLLDGRDPGFVVPSAQQIESICHRRFGIGADGLIVVHPDKELDFSMQYFNADGHEGSMCGNGGRCVTAFAQKLGIIEQECTFRATDGQHHAAFLENGWIKLGMNPVAKPRTILGHVFLDTGSPHLVVFKDDLEDLDVIREGRILRHHAEFQPEGVNVNFVRAQPGLIEVRTYERGVENETWSCGTGVIAAAISAHLRRHTDKFSFMISTRGGELRVDFKAEPDGSFSNIHLFGPATEVFQGSYEFTA